MAKVVTSASSKNTKTRRETAVQGTNDSSIVSKWSTAACGYFDDTFLQHFISKQSRRAPLIHRGYYIRAVAFDRLIRNFLNRFKNTRNQILSLGTGFDSTYFRLKGANLLSNTFFCEVDFPELVRRKRLLIENSKELENLIEKCNAPPLSPHIEFSCTDYQLLGVDLTQLNTLEAALKMCGVDFDCPTLLLSECVMTYMTRRCSTELVKWAAETFEQAVFGMYEQINPDDAFGLFMQAHFHSIGSPLKCINSFPSLQSQENRFLNAGWAWCEAMDMNTFYYHCLEREEQQRVESLETFDEYEELNLKYSHYFILTAATDALSQSLIREGRNVPKLISVPAISEVVLLSRLPEDDQSVRRFGHASSLVQGRYVVTSGGFGETDGRHQRLAELTVTDMDSLKSYHVPCTATHIQVSRMHHSSVTLSNGRTILIHGRQSPYFMCDQMLEVSLQITNSPDHFDTNSAHSTSAQATFSSTGNNSTSSNCEVTSVNTTKDVTNQTQVTSSFRNNGTRLKESDAPEDVAFVSNLKNPGNFTSAEEKDESAQTKSLSQTVNFDLGSVTVKVVEQKGDVPRERWRHAAVGITHNGEEKVFLYGGKVKSGKVLHDAFIFDPQTSTWTECACTGSTPGPRHSHCLTFWQGKVILTGGLDGSHVPSSHMFSLDLGTMVWERWDVQGTLCARYSHTAHVHGDKLLLVGGVNTQQSPPGLAVISLASGAALEFAFPPQDKGSLLMLHRHTSVIAPPGIGGQPGSQLVLLGGGGNCFSFGTHLNRTPVLVDVTAPCSEPPCLG